jgi:hypothetical protein
MIPVETITGIRGGEEKGERWRGKLKGDVFYYCKNIGKCHNAPRPSTTIRNKKRKL